MKKIYLQIFMTVVLISSLRSQCTFGNFPPTFTSSPAWTNGIWLAQKFTLSSTATLTGLALNTVSVTSGAFRMAIYTDVSNAPGNMVSVTSQGSLVMGRNVLSLFNSTVIPAGDYWIAAIFNTSGVPLGTTSSTNTALYLPGGSATPPANMSSWPNATFSNVDYWAVINTPSISIAGTQALCMGNSGTLTASGAVSYTWNGTTVTPSISITPTITTTYTIEATAVNGCTSNVTKGIPVFALPTLTLSSTATLCAGQSLNLVAGGATTYTWNGTVNSATLNVSPATTTGYTVNAGSANGCTATAVKTITVVALPSISISGSSSICAGAVLTLTANGGSSYVWNTGAVTNTVSDTPAINVSYTVTGMSVSGCTASVTHSVTLNSPTLTIAGNATICLGAAANLTVSGAATYLWDNGATTTTLSPVPATSSVYTVAGFDQNTCMSTKTVLVYVNPLPVLSFTLTKPVLCLDEIGTLFVSGASTYSWITGATGASISVSPEQETTYTVQGTNSHGCMNSISMTQSVSACTGISNTESKNSAEVFPNPFKENFEVSLKDGYENAEYTVYSRSGEIVKQGQLISGHANVELVNYPAGFYYVTVKSTTQNFTFKMIRN